MGRHRVAAIDCGTNSTRLLIAGGDGRTLDRRMRITRLGAGVDRTGQLDPAAIERTLAVLEEFRQAMDGAGVERALATATSAVRDSANWEDFIGPAGTVLGTTPVVLTGLVEGALSFRGATAGLDPLAARGAVVLDIGGGSTELVAREAQRRLDGDPAGRVAAVSLDIGCVRVSERFLHTDPPSATELEEARRHVRALVGRAATEHPFFRAAGPWQNRLVGLAGTVSALAVLALGLDGYDRELVHHSVLGRPTVARLTDELAAAPLEQRRRHTGLERDRADVIVGGALVLGVVMDELGYEEALVSESDILDGVVAELLEPSGVLDRP